MISYCNPFLGMFPKLRKWLLAVMSAVHKEQRGSHWTDCHEISYSSIFWQFAKKIQVSLKSDKNNVYFTWRSMYIYDGI